MDRCRSIETGAETALRTQYSGTGGLGRRGGDPWNNSGSFSEEMVPDEQEKGRCPKLTRAY